MDKRNHIKYWLDSAAHDFDVVETLYKTGKYDWCLFAGHLVIEKVLKAFYVRDAGELPPRTHNLLMLAERTTLLFSDERRLLLGEITHFNIEARYPDYKQEFYRLCTKEFAEEYYTKIKELYKWLLLQMRQ
ncbi:MAG TPA: HEPN domain-containing protein [Nitrospirae bacterium]|nr:HEPN domain-containing protein [Nitrospirota bacterium]